MEAIAVINQKGGVGKSTTAHAVGAGLSLRGFRVLYVDLDAQGNLSYTLGADTEGITVMDILRNQAPVREVVRKVEQGDVIPSSPARARPYFCRGRATPTPTARPGEAGPSIRRGCAVVVGAVLVLGAAPKERAPCLAWPGRERGCFRCGQG